MSRKLLVSNRYLRSPEVRRRTLLVSVASSSAIEGIHVAFKKAAKPGMSHSKGGTHTLAVRRSKPVTTVKPRRSGAKSRR